MKKIRWACLMTLMGLMAGCSTTNNSAPVLERGTGVNKGIEVSMAHGSSVQPAPIVKPMEGRGYYTVKKGDTLFHIALDAGQNYRDLVSWNNLANPNDIKVDQVLRVLPPEAGSGGPQTGSVATSSGIEVRPLAASHVVAPFTNKTGPRGEKRHYSETALAELQKPDTGNNTVTASVVKTDPSRVSDSKPVEKPQEVAVSPNTDDDHVAWVWPTEGKIVGHFDENKKGIDIGGKSGQPVLAAGAGTIMYAGGGIRGYGNLVIVKHTNNLLSAYAHNKTILVKEKQSVTKGQKIAEMGNSDSEAVKLHFEIRQQGKPVDPSKFLPNR
jgi:lipoprotein NlpD